MTKWADLVHVQRSFNHLLKLGKIRDKVIEGCNEGCIQQDMMFACQG